MAEDCQMYESVKQDYKTIEESGLLLKLMKQKKKAK